MYNPTKLDRLKRFFTILFCRHRKTKWFEVLGGYDDEHMKVIQRGRECINCGGKRYEAIAPTEQEGQQ